MADSVSGEGPSSPLDGHASPFDGQATIRAVSGSAPPPPATDSDGNNNNSRGTMKFIKDYIWGGGGSGRNSRSSSVNGDAAKQAQTVIRAPVSNDRRPTLQDDLFTPPDTQSVRSSSRASSINNGVTGRKASTPFSTLVRMVAGGGSLAPKDGDFRGRAGGSSVAGGSMRTSSVSSQRTTGSNRAVSTQAGGPKALMSMRRVVTGVPSLPASGVGRPKPEERWDSMVSSPTTDSMSQQESYVPVEMDKILPLEGQPPTLSQFYNNNYGGSGHLTDRFGFIYDQRRKKRQRATQLASQVLAVAAGGKADGASRPILPPIITDDSASHKWDAASEGRPGSPSSTEEVREEGKPSSRWYDYLKVVTFQAGTERTTELLSDTPAMSAPGIEVTEGQEPPKSPAIVQSEDGGFVPHASTPTSAVDTLASASAGPESEPAAATFVKDDVEPVKQLLDQLNSLHDALQRKRMDRWNEFQRKVRAERRKHGGDSSGADNRFHSMPEARLADGELIGIADLGNKGKVGRAKWSEFRTLVLGGIPVVLRAKVWAECSGAIDLRVPGYYDDLIKRPAAEDKADVVTQIRADINRTLTDNIFFRNGVGVERLHEVLLAYSRRNADVGYCQGMNLIAANLLLVTPSAEDAFWLLAAVVERILPVGYYDHSLLASRADQQVLRRYVSELLPRLSAHFEALGIDLETMTFQWFLSVFTDCLSAEALFRVWDVVLCLADGSTFLFQVALALLKLNEQQLLTQCPTPAAVYTYINPR
ncbi:TBC1 domain family member 10A [Magnaporthiopsis poae ATCC 64411]|uniref:TBC1 domain family member 10A n=1 Tax=Magnaporthiopsis poae (strain ATCC 64411 / 73-15) TaxID=644358 RepID=A0A0C4DLU2_MAGP6|nr:TBC1 domain family member 10A [Magnaporthiopsis poae ATCC 64411]